MAENLIERKIIVSTSMGKKVVELLDGYEEDGLKIKYLKNTTPLNAVFQVYTNEDDKEKLSRKIKDMIKSSSFGAALYFTVNVE